MNFFSAGGFAPCASDYIEVDISDSQPTLHSPMTYLFAAWSSPAISGNSSSLAMVGSNRSTCWKWIKGVTVRIKYAS